MDRNPAANRMGGGSIPPLPSRLLEGVQMTTTSYDRIGVVEGFAPGDPRIMEIKPSRIKHPNSQDISDQIDALVAGTIAQGHIHIPRLNGDTDAELKRLAHLVRNNLSNHGNAHGVKVIAMTVEPDDRSRHIYFALKD